MDNNKLYEKELSFQADRRKAGVELIKIISDLWYDKSIELVLFRNQLIDKNVSDIINFHEYAGEFVQKPINIFDSVEIARSIQNLDLPPSRIDIGKLTYEFHLDDNKYNDSRAFVIDKLKNAKDFKNLKQLFIDGGKVEAPIVLQYNNEPFYLVSGNEKLLMMKLLSLSPIVWLFNFSLDSE